MSTLPVKAGYWSSGSLAVGDIESGHFTHLFCAFAEVNSKTYDVTFPSAAKHDFQTFSTTVRVRNQRVKTLLSIGGPLTAPSIFASMASKKESRKTFIDTSIKLARTNKFDGLDLSWLYPSTANQSVHLSELLKDWHEAIVADAKGSDKDQLLLTAQVYYSPAKHYSYPVPDMNSNLLDWVNVLTYDFDSPSKSPKETKAHSAQRNSGEQPSVETGIDAWIHSGMDKKKLVLGLPYYGYAWLLFHETTEGAGAPAKGVHTSYGPTGFIGYDQIKKLLDSGAGENFDTSNRTNYLSRALLWVGYDGIGSITKKVDYAKEKDLLGYFAWHVGIDSDWILSKTAEEKAG